MLVIGEKEKRNKTPGIGVKRQIAADKIYWQAFKPPNYI